MEISLADFFPGTDTPQDRETRKVLGELSEEEIRFLADIKRYSTTLSDDDKKLVLAMIRKMATVIPPPAERQTACCSGVCGASSIKRCQFFRSGNANSLCRIASASIPGTIPR